MLVQRVLMADKDMYATTQLRPLLAERGVALSREQVYRLVTGDPGVAEPGHAGRAVRHPGLRAGGPGSSRSPSPPRTASRPRRRGIGRRGRSGPGWPAPAGR